jgi:integrase
MLLVKDRKDPRRKSGNNQKIPLLDVSGRSVGTASRRTCRALKITDLHFHDLRHEGASRLFEAGFSIEQVGLVTGHRDWKMLRRYTHLKPEQLHARKNGMAA